MSLPALGSTMSTILDSDKRIAGRAGSLSEKKIAQQLRGKDGTVEVGNIHVTSIQLVVVLIMSRFALVICPYRC